MLAREALRMGVGIREILSLETKEKISRAKLIDESNLKEFDEIEKELKSQFKKLATTEEE
jgi:hypothetical protein